MMNLVMPADLVGTLDLGPNHPKAKKLQRVITLMKTAVVQQEVVSTSCDRLRSWLLLCGDSSASRTRRVTNHNHGCNRSTSGTDVRYIIQRLRDERAIREQVTARLKDARDLLNRRRRDREGSDGREVSSRPEPSAGWHDFN